MDLQPPPAMIEIARRLNDAGFDTWAVGGAVRDALLGRPSGDWDLATRARPDEVRKLFRRTIPVGIEHGTVGVFGRDNVMYEVTTFRRDVETFGRHATVSFSDTIEDDLARRDFTLNAIAWHPETRAVRDPFNGLDDLRAGILRTVGEPHERFREDYLRVLRALRFAGEFDLRIDDATWQALRAAAPHTAGLSAERIREELFKVFTKSRTPSRALSLYESSGVLAVRYPELQRVADLERTAEDHPTFWSATLAQLDHTSARHALLRVAILLRYAGVPVARTKDLRGGWRYTGHEVAGARVAEEIMRRLKASNADTERVRLLVAHQNDLFPPDARSATVRRWLRAVGPELVNDLVRIRIAAARAESEMIPEDLVQRIRMARLVIQQHPVIDTRGLAITGNDLKDAGIAPGPQFRQILDALLDAVIDNPELNTRAALLERVRADWAQ